MSLWLSGCGPGQPPALDPSATPTAVPASTLPPTPTQAPPSPAPNPTALPSARPPEPAATRTATAPTRLPTPTPTRAAPTQAWESDKLADIDAAAKQALINIPLAGLTVAVRQSTRPVYTQSYGRADLAAKVPAQPGTLYETASLSKQFTAAAIVQLAEKGRLGLDDHISSYYPDLPPVAGGIIVRQLLNHTSGLPDNEFLYVLLGLPQVYAPKDVVAAYFKSLKVLDFAPGSKWEYSNIGYFLLSDIIEKASGQSYAEYLQQNLFEPAGLTATSYCPTPPPGLAQGYQLVNGQLQPARPDNLSLYFGAGGLCSTAADLIRWQQALAGGRVVSAADYQAMISPATLPDGSLLSYGFGLKVGAYGGHLALYHQGQLSGFSSVLVYYPEADITVALLTNTAVPIVTLDGLAGQIRGLLTSEP